MTIALFYPENKQLQIQQIKRALCHNQVRPKLTHLWLAHKLLCQEQGVEKEEGRFPQSFCSSLPPRGVSTNHFLVTEQKEIGNYLNQTSVIELQNSKRHFFKSQKFFEMVTEDNRMIVEWEKFFFLFLKNRSICQDLWSVEAGFFLFFCYLL